MYETYEVPKRRSWAPDSRGLPDARRPRMREFDPQRRIRLDPYTLLPQQTNPAMLPRIDASIASGRLPVLRALDPLGFRFKKTLGMGGGGIAVLVELVDRNGQADEWVIKAPLGGSQLGREARNMRVSPGQLRPHLWLSLAAGRSTRPRESPIVTLSSGSDHAWGEAHDPAQVRAKICGS